MIRDFRDLVVWQKSMELAVNVYELSKLFPREELYGLTSQIRRAVVSVPSNIAEGQGRDNDREFSRFLDIAMGSVREVETQIAIATRLGYLSQDNSEHVLNLITEVAKLTNALRRKIREELTQ